MNVFLKTVAWLWLVIAFVIALPFMLLAFIFLAMLVATAWAFSVVSNNNIQKMLADIDKRPPSIASVTNHTPPDKRPPSTAEAKYFSK